MCVCVKGLCSGDLVASVRHLEAEVDHLVHQEHTHPQRPQAAPHGPHHQRSHYQKHPQSHLRWERASSWSFAGLLLLAGRCYGAEICTILLLLRCSFRCMVSLFAEIGSIRYLLKTMDYSKAF